MNSHYNDDNRRIVSDYFLLINEKDMQGLLNLFTDDCAIYEPFGKGTLSHNNIREKIHLKGKSEIESFFNIVMMASDGFQYQIEFIDEPIDIDYNQPSDIFGSTSSSIVSVLATFYGNKEGHGLKEWLTFHVVSRKDSILTILSVSHCYCVALVGKILKISTGFKYLGGWCIRLIILL